MAAFLGVIAAIILPLASLSCSVAQLCLTLRPHGLQHTKLLYLPLSPGVCSNPCPLSCWCYLIISSSATSSPVAFSLYQHEGFSSESALGIRWPKCWSSSFSISPSNEYSGLISFRMDWLDLLAVQEILKSPPQHCSSKASILHRLALFMVQLSHPYMTTGKTIAWWYMNVNVLMSSWEKIEGIPQNGRVMT